MKKLSTSKMKSQELRNLFQELLIEADKKEERIAELEEQLEVVEKSWIEMGGLPFRFNTKSGDV